MLKKTWAMPFVVILIMVTTAFIYFNGTSPYCFVTVKGSLFVRSKFNAFYDDLKKLPAVPVRIKVKTANSSATEILMTDEFGEFLHGVKLSNYNGQSCQVNELTVESSFVHGEKLSITQGDWDIVKTWDVIANEKSHQCLESDCFLGDLIFENGAKNSDGVELGDQINYEQADIWWVSMFLINEVERLGFPFKSKLAIAYPFDEWNSQYTTSERRSYANPVTRQIQVVNELFDNSLADMLYHEIGHIWSYDYSSSAMDLVTYFFMNSFNTHGMLASKSVAFYEGFAQTFGEMVYRKLLIEEEITPGNPKYYSHFAKRRFLYPLALQNYTFTHDKIIFPINSSFNDSAKLLSWAEDDKKCIHDKKGTFDCSDPGWISIFASLLLEKQEEETFEAEGATSLINYDLTQNIKKDGMYFNKPRSIPYSEIGCRSRPKLSFSDLLMSIKGNEDEPLMSAQEMNLKNYLARLKRMELGNIRNNQSGEKMINSFYRTFDVGNQDAGSFYHNFCRPSAYLYKASTDDRHRWYFRSGNKAYMALALKMHMTEEVNDLVSLQTSISNNNGKGDVYIRYPSSPDLNENVQKETDFIMLNDLDEEGMKILKYEQNNYLTFSMMVQLNDNGTFPVTRLNFIPRIGCREINDFYYFEEGSIVGNQDFWNRYNCVRNEDDSINHFENSNGDLNWTTHPYILDFGADYLAKADVILMEDFLSSNIKTKSDRKHSIASYFLPVAKARESARERQVRRTKRGKITKRRKNLIQGSKRNQGQVQFEGNYSREPNEESVLIPKLSKDYFEKTYAPEKYLGICDVQNIGNVNPGGQRTKLKSYLYEGELENLMNGREDWRVVNTRKTSKLAPSDGKINYESFTLKAPGMLYLEKQAFLMNKKERVMLQGPVYFICEADAETEIDELDEVNNISITQVRPAIYYDGGLAIGNNLPFLKEQEKSTMTSKLIEQSQLIEQLKELIANGEYTEIKEFYEAQFGPTRLETVPILYQMYFNQKYKN